MTQSPIKITDTTFRDGHQSLLATRLRMEDMEPMAAAMDQIGFHSMEVWGGATFDTATRFLGEDPWERLRKFKELMPNTPLSMLLRGQSLVGYRTYADDVVQEFVERSSENGIDVFRVFDALNDEWNLSKAAESVKNTGKHLQMTLCYSVTESGKMGGPIYSLDYYLSKAELFESMGADSICIKDMAGLLAPYDAYNLVKGLKSKISVPLQLHSHYTSGMASMSVLKAIEAGIDVVDTSLAPLALRTSQPAIEPLVVTLSGTPYDPKLDLEQLLQLGDQLESILPKYRHHLESPKAAVIDAKVLSHQIPGGMASNLLSQLREADAIDKLDEVLEEIPKTRKDLGYPPLVTPMSQMIGSQSVSNVLFGKYEMISGQVKEYVYGMYGRPPSDIDPEIAKTVLKDYKKGSPVIHERPANLLDPEMEKAKSEIADITDNIDDVLIYALYPTTGLKFLRIKHGLDQMPEEMKPGFDSEPVAISRQPRDQYPPKSQLTKTFNVFVENEYFKVEIDPADVLPNQIVPMVNRSEGINQEKISPDFKEPNSKDSVTNNGESLVSPMPGILLRYLVEEGDEVKVGEPVAILEAMKMENTLPSPATGTVQKLQVTEGATVVKGDVLIVLS
tara:strand:+ start:80 stop:1936 length:1857 start_codon:yes stop_codon:yes gene_type:complete